MAEPYDFNFQDSGAAAALAPTRSPMPAPEFDPRRDIATMSPQFFKALDASTALSPEQKLRLQGEYFQGVDQIQEYRSKLEDDRQRSMINDLRIQEAKDSLIGTRRAQAAAEKATQDRAIIAQQIRDVTRANPDPYARFDALNALQAENISVVGTDPAVRNMFDTSLSMIPKPLEPEYTRREIGEAMGELEVALGRAGAAEILSRGNPAEIEAARVVAKHKLDEQKAKETRDVRERAGATRAKNRFILELAKDDFRFMDEEQRSIAGVSGGDTNPYLRPEDHDRGKQLIIAAVSNRGGNTAAALKQFEELPTDADRRQYLQSLRWEAMEQALQAQESVIDDLQNPQGAEADDLFRD